MKFADVLSFFDLGKFRLFYARNKKIATPVFIIIVCIGLFTKVLLPQFVDYLQNRKVAEEALLRIEVLKANSALLSKTNNVESTADLTLVSKALPIEKDFAAVLAAISGSSVRSGAELGDFTFQVGELASSSASKNRSSLSLVLTLRGVDAVSTKRFLSELSKSLPVSEVSELKLSNTLSSVNTAFYYRPLTQTKLDYTIPLTPLSPSETELLRTLSLWNSPSSVSSPSAF